MDSLITLIGNAVVDPIFRGKFLARPVDTTDHYGFRLTKADFELMRTVFEDLGDPDKLEFEEAFLTLENLVYGRIERKIGCQSRPCFMSISPPPDLRADWPKAEQDTEPTGPTKRVVQLKKRTGTR